MKKSMQEYFLDGLVKSMMLPVWDQFRVLSKSTIEILNVILSNMSFTIANKAKLLGCSVGNKSPTSIKSRVKIRRHPYRISN